LKIGAGIIFFNCRQELRRCLDSLKSLDTVIAIDGRFPTHPSRYRYSKDWSKELCDKYGNVHYYRYARNQIMKRNLYLDLAKLYNLDYILVMDSDSWLEIEDWDKFKKQLEANLNDDHIMYLVKFQNGDHNFHWLYLFKPKGLKYFKLHNLIVHKCGFRTLIPWSPYEKFVHGITIHHDHALRTGQQIIQTMEYRHNKQPIESKLREAMGYMPYASNEL